MGRWGYVVKPRVKTWTLVGGGLKDARWGAVGPTGWSENHHKGGGVEVYLLMQMGKAALQPSLGQCGAQHKISKNKARGKSRVELGYYHISKAQGMIPLT